MVECNSAVAVASTGILALARGHDLYNLILTHGCSQFTESYSNCMSYVNKLAQHGTRSIKTCTSMQADTAVT